MNSEEEGLQPPQMSFQAARVEGLGFRIGFGLYWDFGPVVGIRVSGSSTLFFALRSAGVRA